MSYVTISYMFAARSEHTLSSVNRSTTDSHTFQLLNPLPSKHFLIYIPMEWATNSSRYLYGTVRASGAPVHQLALLLDTRKDVTRQGSNLQASPLSYIP